MTNDTGVRTPDPDDENEDQDHDDGGTGFPVDESQYIPRLPPGVYTVNSQGEVNPGDLSDSAKERLNALPDAVAQFAGYFSPWATHPRQEKQEPPKEEIPVRLYGMDKIKDMSNEQMVEELLYHQGIVFRRLDRHQLIHTIINARMTSYKFRLAEESGLDGWHTTIAGDED